MMTARLFEVCCDESCYHHPGNLQETGIAKKFSQMCARASQGEKLLAADVMEYLEAAHLPLESLTLTYNILVELSKPTSTLIRNDSCSAGEYLIEEEKMICRSELLLLASLQLAASLRDNRNSPWTHWNHDSLPQNIDSEELWRASAELYERVAKRLPAMASQEAHFSTLKMLDIGHDTIPCGGAFDGGFARKKSIRKVVGYFDGY